MKKLIAILVSGLFATAAFAQAPAPQKAAAPAKTEMKAEKAEVKAEAKAEKAAPKADKAPAKK